MKRRTVLKALTGFVAGVFVPWKKQDLPFPEESLAILRKPGKEYWIWDVSNPVRFRDLRIGDVFMIRNSDKTFRPGYYKAVSDPFPVEKPDFEGHVQIRTDYCERDHGQWYA